MTNCKFRETIFCNHNHHYNISRHDIIAYVPIERDEGPTWVPPQEQPRSTSPPVIKRPKIPVRPAPAKADPAVREAPRPKDEPARPKAKPEIAPIEKPPPVRGPPKPDSPKGKPKPRLAPIITSEKVKVYPYPKPGVSEKCEPIIMRGLQITKVIQQPREPPKKKMCSKCFLREPDHDGIICSDCVRCYRCKERQPDLN